MRPRPGSPEFETALLERLRSDARIGPDTAREQLRIACVERTSRNTLIYRVRGGGRALVAKAQLTRPPEAVAIEHRALRDLRSRVGAADGVRTLEALASYTDLGVLVTLEVDGCTLRDLIDRAIACDDKSTQERAADGVRRAARALACFHGADGGGDAAAAAGRDVRLYLDFSPRNVLVPAAAADGSIVLIDPPCESRTGPAAHDLGTFAFDLARAGFLPRALWRRPQPWIDELKWIFLDSYCRARGAVLTRRDLRGVRDGEAARARHAFACMTRFWRHRNWPRELARCCYFLPVAAWYSSLRLRTSYRALASYLERRARMAVA